MVLLSLLELIHFPSHLKQNLDTPIQPWANTPQQMTQTTQKVHSSRSA